VSEINGRWARYLVLYLSFMLVGGTAMAENEANLLPVPKLNEEGLYEQLWFENTFFDFHQDMKEASAQGKRLVVFWEQRGCPYCKATHETNLRIPMIVNYIKNNFYVLRLNLWGSIDVTDFDGEVLSEKNLARKYDILFTPTIQFFPEALEKFDSKPDYKAEVMRVPGYFKPFEFYFLFRYVNENGYEQEPSFQAWLNARGNELRARGIDVDGMLWSDTLDLEE